jgi:hypothetical protein
LAAPLSPKISLFTVEMGEIRKGSVMANTSSKGISLRPSSFEEGTKPETLANENKEFGLLIGRLIGPGVTVIATPQDKDHLRYIFCEQMAASVSRGGKFLDLFETQKCHVLLVAHGTADFKGMKARNIVAQYQNIKTEYEWPRIGLGCIRKLQEHKNAYSNFKLAFLGNFDFIKSILGHYIEKKLLVNKQNLSKGNYAFESLIREMEIENIHRLKNFCDENEVSIVLGHDLNKNATNLLYTRGLYKCDTEIHVREIDGGWRLKVIPKMNKRHIQTHTWDMTYNGQNFFKIHEQHREESRMMEALSEGTLPLNEKEMEIIDAIWGKEPMSVTKIAEVTNISRSTVDQRLKALEKSNKGEWIVSLKGNKGKLFIADMNKKRDWAY